MKPEPDQRWSSGLWVQLLAGSLRVEAGDSCWTRTQRLRPHLALLPVSWEGKQGLEG